MSSNAVAHLATVHVAVGVIFDENRRVLITQRSARQHLGGYWEFPGGKVEPDESVQQSLARELREELGIDIVGEFTRPLCIVEHDYGDKKVALDVWQITRYQGTPSGLEGQPLRWVAVGDLQADQFPAANRAIIRSIQLPEQIAIVNMSPESRPVALPLMDDTTASPPLTRLRAAWPALATENLTRDQRYEIGSAYLRAAEACLETLARRGLGALLDLAPLLEHSTEILSQLTSRFPSFQGLHCNRWLLPINDRHTGFGETSLTAWLRELRRQDHLWHLWIGASCHSREELDAASELGADFALLSPVKPTPSHPNAIPLGWPGFKRQVAGSRLAVYALGGMRATDLITAQHAGGRGIAGVSLFLTHPANTAAPREPTSTD